MMTFTNWRSRVAAFGFFALLVVGTAWFVLPAIVGDQSSSLLRAGDAQTVALGKQVYAQSCASCHGAALEGQADWQTRDADGYLPAPPHDETGHTWHHDDQLLFKLTKFGLKSLAGEDYNTRMPAYDGLLTDEEIVAALSFIKSQWPEDVQRRHDQFNERQR